VGKSSLVVRFTDDSFDVEEKATIGVDFKVKSVTINATKVKLAIWDTAGQERFQTITTSYYRGAMGIMLVYDITQTSTFGNINKWLRNIEDHATDNVAKLILGNKCDMENRRVVPTEQGEQLARSKGLKFLETSAKANINIDKAFTMIAEDILSKTPNPSLKPVDPVINPGESTSNSGCSC
jgi:Ras-related protein Rab-10